jgi:ribosome-associated toxin RatA of RatAB toxin-antitoxin module
MSRVTLRAWAVFSILAAVPLLVRADSLEALLAKGPLVLVENDAKGKFSAATGIIFIEAPLEKTWATVIDFARYKEFVPKVVEAEVAGAGNELKVTWELDVPGINTTYTVAYHLDPAAKTIVAEQVKGDLKGSKWAWQLEASGPNRTLIHYRSQALHFSRILESAEDDQKTITIGVNVGGVLTVLRALKTRVEGK